MLMQTFYDYWFSEAKLPSFSNQESLLKMLSYFFERVTNIESKSYNDIIRINTLYTNFSTNIYALIANGKMNQDDCIKLHQFLNDETFFGCFIAVFLELVKKDYEINFNRYFLALHKVFYYYYCLLTIKVFKNVFDEKDGIMLLFKKMFLDYLMIEYSHIANAEQRGDNRKLLKDIERIMRRFLELFEDKKEKNYDDMKKGLINHFDEFDVNLLVEEEEIKEDNCEKKSIDLKVASNSNEETIKMLGRKRIKKLKGMKVKKENDKSDAVKRIDVKNKGYKNSLKEKETDEKGRKKNKNQSDITNRRKKRLGKGVEIQKGKKAKIEEEDDEKEEEEEDDEENEDDKIDENDEEEIKGRGKIPKQLEYSKSPQKEKTKQSQSNAKKTTANPQDNIYTRRSSRFIESINSSKIKTKTKYTKPSKSLSKEKSFKKQPKMQMTTRGRKPKETSNTKSKLKTQTKTSPNRSTTRNNLIPVKSKQTSPKPKSILKKDKRLRSASSSTKEKKEETPSPRKQRQQARSKTPSPSPNKKKKSESTFYLVLEEKYKKEKRTSPRKFNITPMKVSKKSKENEVKKSISKTKQKIDFDDLQKPKQDFLGKKRNISFSSNHLVKEFDPKTPVKEIIKRGERVSPMDKKKQRKQKRKR